MYHIAILGVDIVIIGVDITSLGVDIAVLGVDIAVFGVDIAIVGVDIAVLGVDDAGRGGRGGVAISHVRRFEAGWRAREFEDTRSHKEREAPCYYPILEVRSGRGLGCRGTVRRSVRGRRVVTCF